MSTTDRLREHLRMRAEAIEVEAKESPAGTPVRRRNRRFLPALAAAAFVLVAVGGAALFVSLDDAGDEAGLAEAADGSTTTIDASVGAVEASSGPLAWAAVPFGAPGGETSPASPPYVVATAQGYVAVADSFGAAPAEGSAVPSGSLVVWVSDSGADWSEVPSPPTSEGSSFIAGVASTGSQVLVLTEEYPSEEPTTTRERSTFVVHSSADGVTWQRQVLPPPSSADLGEFEYLNLSFEDVVAGNGRAIVRATGYQEVDVDAVAREVLGLSREEITGYMTDEVQIEVDLTNGETRSVSYADLGITRVPGTALVNSVLWVTLDGEEWMLVEGADLPFPEGASMTAVTSNGFVAAGFGEGGPAITTSGDGETWAPVDMAQFGSLDAVIGVAADGEAAVLLTRGSNDAVRAWSSRDGRMWLLLADLSDTVPGDIQVGEMTVGPAGVVFAGSTSEGAEGLLESQPPEASPSDIAPLAIEVDGRVLMLDFEAGRIVLVEGPAGTVLLDEEVDFDAEEPPDFIRVEGDTGFVAVLDPDTGEELFRYGPEDISRAQGEVQSISSESGFEVAGVPSSMLFYSADGVVWEPVTLGDAEGVGPVPVSITVGRDAVIVAAATISPGGGFSDYHLWRGAPTG